MSVSHPIKNEIAKLKWIFIVFEYYKKHSIINIIMQDYVISFELPVKVMYENANGTLKNAKLPEIIQANLTEIVSMYRHKVNYLPNVHLHCEENEYDSFICEELGKKIQVKNQSYTMGNEKLLAKWTLSLDAELTHELVETLIYDNMLQTYSSENDTILLDHLPTDTLYYCFKVTNTPTNISYSISN